MRTRSYRRPSAVKYLGECRPRARAFGSKGPSTPAIRQSIDVTESFWKSTQL